MIRNAVSRWMWDNSITGRQIARATGASKASVSMTIKGERNDPRVLDYLRAQGCPHLYIEARQKKTTHK
jgi:predicted transcriptional regulator